MTQNLIDRLKDQIVPRQNKQSNIGSLGSIVFEASTNKVHSFNSLTKTSKSKYAEHEIIHGKPKLAYIGKELDEYNMEIALKKSLGVDPESAVSALEQYKADGEVVVLMLGTIVKGQVVITNLKTDYRHIDNNGVVHTINASLTLKEYN
jgi:phage protein U